MRDRSIYRRLLGFLAFIFAVVLLVSLHLATELDRLSAEARTLSENLRITLTLNRELQEGISTHIHLLYRQFESPAPEFQEEFNTMNRELGNRHTRYLKMPIGPAERLAVERIRELQAELGVTAIQINEHLQAGNRARAIKGVTRVEELKGRIDKEFASLNHEEMSRVVEAQANMDRLAALANAHIYALAGALTLVLMALANFFRNRIMKPLRAIQEGADKIRKGDFGARVGVSQLDEIGRLANDFNFMAASLAESYAGLERKVDERTRQLQALQQQLVQEAKMSAVGRLVSGVAHELNNPLTVIMGQTELWSNRLKTNGVSQRQLEIVEELRFQSDRCRKIVANLLQFARRQEPRLEAVHVNKLIERILQLREYEMATRNIRLVRDFCPGDPVICADPNKLQQVVLNLLNNSYDAIRETGGPGTIRVRTDLRDGKFTMEFLDDGVGMSEPDRVFDPFYTTKEVGSGTGLGLSVCYGIVEEHQGDIRAYNRDGGALFVVNLPVGDPKTLKDQRKSESKPMESPREYSALVVDDEEAVLKLQIELLSTLGVRAEGVRSGREAVQFLEGHPVDIVVSDVRMPGEIGGIELYHWIAENRPDLSKRFLFVSGDTVEMNLGGVSFDPRIPCIQKPFSFEDYSRLVREVLED